MLFRHRANRFHHTYIYADDKKQKIADIKQRALDEINRSEKEYEASDIRGFLTDRHRRHLIPTSAALLLILLFAVIWYLLIF